MPINFTGYLPLVIIFYGFTVLILLFKYFEFKIWLKRYIAFGILFFGLVFVIFFNQYLDPISIRVDRWSAMKTGIESVLHHSYPYAATDHLGGRTSNLPGLMLIGLPFYVIGDVGLLQVFVFLVFVVFQLKNYDKQILVLSLLLLLFSPSYWWEVLVKSDLMSNIILILVFSLFFLLKIRNSKKPLWFVIGVITGILFLTRLVVVIPLILVFTRYIIENKPVKIFKLITGFLITVVLLLFLVVKDCPDRETFLHYNPLNLQGGVTPLWLNIIAILLAVSLSFYVKNVLNFLVYSIVLIAIPIFYGFFDSIIKYGWQQTIFYDTYDISYFGMLLPFIIVFLAIVTSNKIQKTSITQI